MKKLAVILLALSMVASFTGCGKNTEVNTNQNVVENEPVKVEQPVVDVEQVADVEAEPEPKPEKKINFKDVNKKMWVSADCNVRSKANKESKKLGRLEMADKVTVIGEGVNAAKHWYKIKFNGKTAYVGKQFLTSTEIKKPSPQSDKAISTVVPSNNNSSSNNSSSSKPSSSSNNSSKPSNNSSKPSSGSSNSSKPSGGSNNSSKPSGGGITHGDASQFGGATGGTVTGQDTSDIDPSDTDTSGWH